ncbi:carbohydrate ABC transporter permease [Paenibacillus monticola]|uniref:ABC transporter permease subunit n=1 Tax=Paenibacillus monticola TaxID=2666075 RepID=A0A7X2L2U1_9BACL|nr:sugar ABC transporter permease [Paenibacillus monticola]MRN53691.1 ABC transporter permease subunit [Paenibacillus monticola]
MNLARLKKKSYPYLFLAPFAILTLMFFVIPALATLWMAATNLDRKMKADFIGFGNFQRIFADINILPIIKVTLIYVFFSLVLTVAFSLLLAICTQYLVKNKKLGALYRVIWLIPSTMPGLVYVVFWKYIFNPTPGGFANKIVMYFGLEQPISWFNDAGLLIIIIAGVISGASGGMILFSASINSIPEDVYKAARVDGAKDRSIIRDIILPALKWPIMYVTVTSTIGLFASYNFILLATRGGPVVDTTTLALYGYQQAFNRLEYGYGAAISVIVVIISLLLTLLLFRLFDFNKLIRPPRIED